LIAWWYPWTTLLLAAVVQRTRGYALVIVAEAIANKDPPWHRPVEYPDAQNTLKDRHLATAEYRWLRIEESDVFQDSVTTT
jgi:hypothetical protein